MACPPCYQCDESERRVLDHMRMLKAAQADGELIGSYRKGEIGAVIREEAVDPDLRVVDLLREEKYQDLLIKQRDGRVVRFHRRLIDKVG